MNWYLDVLKKYAVFGGRARRKEYWYFVLFNILISILLGIIDVVTGSFSPEAGLGLLSGLYTLAIVIPGIAVSVRRFHEWKKRMVAFNRSCATRRGHCAASLHGARQSTGRESVWP